MGIVINPGTGPVDGATEDHAISNIKHFITDCGVDRLNWVRIPAQDDRGRFAFLLYKHTRCHLIEMPGLPLDRMRYMGEPQNIWDFPRLYVDGSSWVWEFAILKEEDFEDPED